MASAVSDGNNHSVTEVDPMADLRHTRLIGQRSWLPPKIARCSSGRLRIAILMRRSSGGRGSCSRLLRRDHGPRASLGAAAGQETDGADTGSASNGLRKPPSANFTVTLSTSWGLARL